MLYRKPLKLGNRRMLLAIATCVRLHNVLVGAFHDGVEDDWSEQLEGLAREEA
eukprot:COSAG02_NODE_9619_length_2159_cov_1.753883_4_plen_52_part_01